MILVIDSIRLSLFDTIDKKGDYPKRIIILYAWDGEKPLKWTKNGIEVPDQEDTRYFPFGFIRGKAETVVVTCIDANGSKSGIVINDSLLDFLLSDHIENNEAETSETDYRI